MCVNIVVRWLSNVSKNKSIEWISESEITKVKRLKKKIESSIIYSLLHKSVICVSERKIIIIFKKFIDSKCTKSTIMHIYLIIRSVSIIVENSLAPFWHTFYKIFRILLR